MRLTNNPPPFTSELSIDYGPVGLFGRFFLRAESLAAQCGVRLSFGTLDDLITVNSENLDTWHPLISIFDRRVSDLGPHNTYVVLGRDRNDDVVATQAGRILDLSNASFKDEAESLRLFYAGGRSHPAAFAGETCTVNAPSAASIRGHVMFSGGSWYRPDFRGSRLSRFLPRISHVYGHARWNTDTIMTMMSEKNMKYGMADRSGYPNQEWDVQLAGGPLGSMRFAMVWKSTVETIADLSTFFDTVAPTLEREIAEGRRSSARVA